jgi:1,4-alpha-glucan branching enzyme
VVTAPFDAELFGHWWFEGPRFLESALRHLATMEGAPRPTTPPEYLRANPVQQVAEPAVSSWGDGGYFKVWCNGGNDWVWRPLQQAQEAYTRQFKAHGMPVGGWRLRVVKQITRELLLAQSSDWPFIVTMGTQMGYARQQPLVHLNRFWRLMDLWQQESEALSEDQLRDLQQLEDRDNIFPDVNPAAFSVA